jgi:hypothetical protein
MLLNSVVKVIEGSTGVTVSKVVMMFRKHLLSM